MQTSLITDGKRWYLGWLSISVICVVRFIFDPMAHGPNGIIVIIMAIISLTIVNSACLLEIDMLSNCWDTD